MAAGFAAGVIQANGEIPVKPLMDLSVAANAVLCMARLPLEANVLFRTVIARKMPFLGRGWGRACVHRLKIKQGLLPT